jgi:HSP20 family protein
MFFATTTPTPFSRGLHTPAGLSFERFLQQAQRATRAAVNNSGYQATQDDKSYTLRFDVPGLTREQLSVAIEGNVVRITSREDAPRQYRMAYELPEEIDIAHSSAKLEHGVLTLNLGRLVPVSRVTELAIS